MSFTDILAVSDIHLDIDVANGREALEFLSAKAAEKEGLDTVLCSEAMLAREKLGSTGLGKGVAIPHAVIKGLTRRVALLARLASPVDFSAPDDEPVDLVLMLLIPEQSGGDQVKVLSRFAKVLRESSVLAQLRSAPDAASMLAALDVPQPAI